MTAESAAAIPYGMGMDANMKLYRLGPRYLRGVVPGREQFYRKVLASPSVQALMRSGELLRTEPSSALIAGHTLVLEQPRLPFVTYPHEWSAHMFLDAARLILDLNVALMADGLCLHDAHPWNVLFWGNRPVFVDFGSIEELPANGRWPAQAEFRKYCLNGLNLIRLGQFRVFRGAAAQILDGIPDELAASVVRLDALRRKKRRDRLSFTSWLRRLLVPLAGRLKLKLIKRAKGAGSLAELTQLQQMLRSYPLKVAADHWTNYYAGTQNELPVYDGSEASMQQCMASTAKHRLVASVLGQRAPGTLLDIGCNRGLYSHYAASLGWQAIGIETDEAAVDQFYLDAKARGLQVAPAFIDVVAPREAGGYWHKPFPGAAQRLQADAVLCLAVVHHLVFGRPELKFPDIAHILDRLTRRLLVVELVPPHDKYIKSWIRPEHAWYTLENFLTELRKYFPQVTVHESFPEPRQLLVCER